MYYEKNKNKVNDSSKEKKTGFIREILGEGMGPFYGNLFAVSMFIIGVTYCAKQHQKVSASSNNEGMNIANQYFIRDTIDSSFNDVSTNVNAIFSQSNNMYILDKEYKFGKQNDALDIQSQNKSPFVYVTIDSLLRK